MQKIRTLMVDDETLALQEISFLMEDFEDFEIVGKAKNVEEALELSEKLQPDLLLLDIQLEDKTAFDLLEKLEQVPEVIFITAYSHYALRAFETNALDYLLKPIETERLGKALEKVKISLNKSLQNEKQHDPILKTDSKVFIKDGEQCFFVQLTDIYLIETIGNYSRVYFKNEKPFLRKSLNLLEEKLPKEAFFRINRRQIINLSFIKNVELSFKGKLLVFLQNLILEVSARQSVKFKELMSL